jgi:hypothetical protein
MERRVLLLILAAIVLGLTAYGFRRGQTTFATAINRFTFAKIREGMTQAEVEALLEVPPGNYSTTVTAVRGTTWRASQNDARLEEWWSDAGVVRVYFDRSDKVVHKEFLEVELGSDSWVREAWRWLGR